MMSKILVLAEKPSVGRDIAKAIGCTKVSNGYIEGSKYIVTWALGHLITLADPEKYDNKYATWKLEDLPIMPDNLQLVVIPATSKQYKTVKDLLHRKDVASIIIATDSGREGELVARWILEKSNCKKPIKRLWISSVTNKAIIDGFNNLKDGKEYENLYKSAAARSHADWVVGINATRALTTKYNAQLSCGRVQTPTLAIIEQREQEIKKFIPTKFYGITLNAKGTDFVWLKNGLDTRVFDIDICNKTFENIKNLKAEVVEVEKKQKKKYSKPLYDLTELQRDANNMFGFSAKYTLSVVQSLYENHKILTYPRTDSRYIPKDVVDTIPERLKAITLNMYKPFITIINKSKIIPKPHFVDDKKVSDHHAIIPTEQKANYVNLTDTEKKIYDLVVKRFLSVLLPAFEYEETVIKLNINKEVFVAKGDVVKAKGYKQVYENSGDYDKEIKENELTLDIKKGDIISVDNIKIIDGLTKAPAYLNEATLLSAMENPGKYVTDKEISKTLGETGGLGTVATRGEIIEKLFNSFLIEKNNRDIRTTAKGKQLLSLAPIELKKPELTGEWEQKLTKIAKGDMSSKEFLKEAKIYTEKIVSQIKVDTSKFKHDNITRHKCELCEKYLLEVSNNKGKILVCQDRECGYRKNLSIITNSRCPKCKKKLEIVGDGEKRKFVCKCGFRESHSKFVEKRSKEHSNINKKEVQKYLNNQSKTEDEELNSKLLDALSSLKF
jgi:DNA topoisomerase III